MDSQTIQYINVILPLPLQRLYTYKVPTYLQEKCEIGKRAVVQFGKKKIYSCLIYEIHTKKPEHYEVKEILSILDDFPVVNRLQFKFWEWIANYYMCSIGEVYKAALPSGLKLESETKIILKAPPENKDRLSREEAILVDIITDKNMLTLNEISNIFDPRTAIKTVKALIDKDIIFPEEKLKDSYKPKSEIYVKLSDELYDEKVLHELFNKLAKAPKQLNLLMKFIQITDFFNEDSAIEIKRGELIEKSGVSSSVFLSLVKKNIFELYEKNVSRLEKTTSNNLNLKDLNKPQLNAFNEIMKKFEAFDVNLLHGVTSSGKTEVYIYLIDYYLKKGKQVLYLLPEIALTTQIINRLKNAFGSKVGIYHSKFNDAERVEIWKNSSPEHAQNNEAYQLVLGVRSSVFLPFNNLGLIIVDEEHENTYKQFDPAPRYNARDAAIVLAKLHNAKVLLGTATPAIETYSNCIARKYGKIELNQRYQNIKLPEITVVDIRKATKRKKMKAHFSETLVEHIQMALDKKEQIILFQNRRGFSPVLECETCGWVPKCQNCDVSLTYHKNINYLVCHYCGYTYSVPSKCLACEEPTLKTKGLGTQRLEDEIELLFPDARVLRMDTDSTRSKKAYQEIISKFENQQIDILIGTQMVSKGLDFNKVSLVAIMNADNMLNFPDFRAFERSYQLMAQVSGRAGRKDKQGKVIIQTYSSEHQIIKDVIKNDYLNMYRLQMYERKRYKYPPYYRLIKLTLKHKKIENLNQASKELSDNLRKVFGQRILGPEFPPVNRIQNWYLKNILIKIERERSFNKAKKFLKQEIDQLKSNNRHGNIIIIADVDPM